MLHLLLLALYGKDYNLIGGGGC